MVYRVWRMPVISFQQQRRSTHSLVQISA